MAESVTAPMVGKVYEIRCKVGDRVQENQVVMVLEAMKMEVPVLAPASGTVKQINVVLGNTVESDTIVMIIE